MESHISNNEKIDGYLVYTRRKRKQTASELSKSAITSNSLASKGKVDDLIVDMPEDAAEKDGSNPDGDWRCPNCSGNDDMSEPIKNFKTHKKENKPFSTCSLCSRAKKKLKLSEDKAVKSVSLNFSLADEPNASAEFVKSEVANKGKAKVCDGIILKDTLNKTKLSNINKIKCDKLLMLRKNSQVCLDSMEEVPNSDKLKLLEQDPTTMKQRDPVHNKEGQARKEKYAKLRARQKERVALKNRNKEPLSSSRQVRPKQSSALEITKYDKRVALNALTSWKGADTQYSSRIGLSGQDKITPISSSHLKVGSASGFTSRPENINTATTMRPSGFLKSKKSMDGWSELELDALWVSVRRYGQGNWEAILADPVMKILKNKTPQDLAMKWDKETLRIFPSAIAITKSTVPPTTCTGSGTTAMQFPSTKVPAHDSGSGIHRFPLGVENKGLNWRKSMPSLNSSIFGSYNQGSSSSIVSHSFQNSAPQRTPHVNLKPMVSEHVQNLNQRTNYLDRNLRPMRVQASQTTPKVLSSKRNSSSTKAEAEAETKYLFCGHYQLPKVVIHNNNKNAVHGTSNNKSNP